MKISNKKIRNSLKEMLVEPEKEWVDKTRSRIRALNHANKSTGKSFWEKFNLVLQPKYFKTVSVVFLVITIPSILIGAFVLLQQTKVNKSHYNTQILSEVTGKGKIFKDGKWHNISDNIKLAKGDRVKAEVGNVSVGFSNGDKLTLSSNTELEILEIDDNLIKVEQYYGSTYCDLIENSSRKFYLNDNKVSTKALGTEYFYKHEKGSDKVYVFVIENRVEFSFEDKLENLTSDKKLILNLENNEISIEEISDNDMNLIDSVKNYTQNNMGFDDRDKSIWSNFVSDKYPQIFKISDSLGNTSYYSQGSENDADWIPPIPQIVAGDSIRFDVEAGDPNNDVLYYKYIVEYSSGKIEVLSDWSQNNTFTWKTSDNDVDGRVNIIINIKDADSDFQFDIFGGVDDLNGQIAYEILPSGSSSEFPYPIILSTHDSFNTISYYSAGNGNPAESAVKREVEVGSKITWGVDAADPQNDTLYYKYVLFHSYGNTVLKNWTKNNTFTWTVTEDFLSGDNSLSIMIKDTDEVYRFQGSYDDLGGIFHYEFVPESGVVNPIITSIGDGIGNISTYSWGNGNVADWSDYISVSNGQELTFTINADAKGTGPLQYRFNLIDNQTGSLVVVQDWSSDNTYSWTVNGEPNEKYRWSFDIKNGDDYYRFSEMDDYNNQIRYKISN